MQRLIPWFVVLGALTGDIFALGRLRAEFAASPILNSIAKRTAQQGPAYADANLRQAGLNANRSQFSPLSLTLALARLAREAGDAASVPSEQVGEYCRSLSLLGEALVRQPLHSGLLINWANLRQLLGTFDCKLPGTVGDAPAVLELALRQDPTNPRVQYNAGQIYFWLGSPDKAQSAFRQALELGFRLSPGQSDFVLNLINTGADIQAVVPDRFPQVVDWSVMIYNSKPHLFDSATKELSEMQLRAIQASREDMAQARISGELHRDRLLALDKVRASTTVRRFIDDELSRLEAELGNRTLVSYYRERREYQDLTVIPAALSADTVPAKSSFCSWGADSRLALDDFYQSIGFFIPPGQHVKLFEIEGPSAADKFPIEQVQVLGSSNNQQWVDIGANITKRVVPLRGRISLVFSVNDPGEYRYWKIHWSRSARDRMMLGDLDKMLRVFGYREGSK